MLRRWPTDLAGARMSLSSTRVSDQLVLVLSAMRAGEIAFREIGLRGSEDHVEPAGDDVVFLFNRAGEAMIELGAGSSPLPIRRGSFAAFPNGAGFRLSLLSGQREAVLIAGRISVDRRRAGPMLAALPTLLFMCPTRDLGIAWQDATFDLIEDCARKADPGSRAVLQRLLETLFAITVQRALADGAEPHQQVRARNPSIGRALLLLQDRPGEPWTVERLASAVAMSASTFARTFAAWSANRPWPTSHAFEWSGRRKRWPRRTLLWAGSPVSLAIARTRRSHGLSAVSTASGPEPFVRQPRRGCSSQTGPASAARLLHRHPRGAWLIHRAANSKGR
jgi:hypothetical protein